MTLCGFNVFCVWKGVWMWIFAHYCGRVACEAAWHTCPSVGTRLLLRRSGKPSLVMRSFGTLLPRIRGVVVCASCGCGCVRAPLPPNPTPKFPPLYNVLKTTFLAPKMPKYCLFWPKNTHFCPIFAQNYPKSTKIWQNQQKSTKILPKSTKIH